jgi:hypothetical protein
MYGNQVTSLSVAAEFYGRQYTAGRFLAAVYRRDLGRVLVYRVDVSLVPGRSGNDHMFDIALARIGYALRKRPCYSSVSALRRAIWRAADGARYGEPKVKIICLDRCPSDDDCEVMGVTLDQVRQYEARRRWPAA